MTLELDYLLHDRYRIREELGHGGMGAVYRAVDENLGVEVAIKENLFSTPEAERQFKREATLLASLRHPNLPRVTDHFVVSEQGQYLVMDFIPGEDAKQRLERQAGPLPEADVLRWAREVLDALKYLHGRQPPIVHRDIKPGNIKITPDGRAVLVDFGLAKIHDTSHSTTVGAKALTPGFAPPEQYGLGRTEPRTDIYSLAATLYALLTGKMPADSLERAMGKQTLTPTRDLNPNVTPDVSVAIERALAVKPEDRFATAADFSAELAAAAQAPAPLPVIVSAPIDAPTRAGHTLPAPTTAAPPAAGTVPTSSRPGWVFPTLVAVLVALGAGGAGLWFSGAASPLLAAIGIQLTPAAVSTPTVQIEPTRAASTNTAEPPTAAPTPTAAATTEAVAPATSTAPATATETQVLETPSPAPTPRGGGQGQIAFVSERAGAPQIFLMNVDGSDQKQLTFIPDGACQPRWSPDGLKLLFVSPCSAKDERYPRAAIFSMNADGTNIQPFISRLGGVYDADWSPEGIAFTYLENNQPRVWIVQENGAGERQVSQPRSADSQPSWSPGGDRLVFLNTSRASIPTLYWMRQDGSFAEGRSNPDQITRDQTVGSPDWSPAGDLIAYVVNQQITIIKWDALGFGPVQLTSRGPNADPDWAPDGRWITFESWRDAANHDIYIMASNGGLQTRITDDSAADYQPAWRP